MSVCENCGAELSGAENYCSQCGRPLRVSASSSGQPGWLLLAGAVTGAVAAVFAGYVISYLLLKVALAVAANGLIPPQSLAIFDRIAPRMAGLEYLSAHHIPISGAGRGGAALSFLLPLRTWTLVPIVSLLLGGWVCAAVGRPSGRRDVLTAAFTSAAVYVAFLLYLRPLFSVNSAVVNLVQFGERVKNMPALPPVALAGSLFSIIFEIGLISLILFGLGMALHNRGSIWQPVKDFLLGRGLFPSWAAGALLAVVIGHLILLALLTLGGIGAFIKGNNAAFLGAVLFGPSISSLVYYLFHSVPIVFLSATSFGSSTISQMITVSLSRGIRDVGRLPGEPWKVVSVKPLPDVLWLGLLLPVLAVAVSAYVTYRHREKEESPVWYAAKFAASYAVLLLLLASFYSFRMVSADVAPGFGGLSRTAISVSPGIWPTLGFGLLVGFIGALVGTWVLSRRAAQDVQPEQQTEEQEQ